MAGSQRFKFQGTLFQITADFHGDSPSSPIAGITKTNPARVTETSHGRLDGDVVKIQNVLGMTDVNNDIYIIDVIDANHYDLVGVDARGYNAYVSGGIVDAATFSNFCELTGWNRQGGSKPEINATSACSIAAEYELGLQDFGTLQIDFFFAPQTAIQEAISAFNASGDKMAARFVLPKSGGKRTALGFVQQVSEQVSVDGIWTGSLTIRLTGEPYDQAG